MTLVIAHRGASRDAPENTLAAFELAVEQRADMIETDLHRTADGEIAIYHDDDVDGVPIGRLTLAELRERLPDMPTLRQTLDACGTRIPFNLELKAPRSGDYPGLEAMVLDEVRARGLLERTLFSSFRGSVLRRLRLLEPRARLGMLLSSRHPFLVGARARLLQAEAANPPLQAVDAARVRRWHAAHLKVNVYTVDRPEDQERLVAQGVDGIFTNVPKQLRSILGG